MNNRIVIFLTSWSIVLFTTVYAGLKAWYLPITGDEASSFLDLQYMNPGYFFGSTPNTHLLNTAWMALVSPVSTSPFALRFLSVFSTLVCGAAIIQLFRSRNEHELLLPVLLLIFLHSYLVDFFSLARGYAQAMSLMVVALYFISQYLNGRTLTHFILASGAAGLSCLAAYTMLNFYLLVLVWFAYDLFRQQRYRALLFLLPHAVLVLLVAYVLSGFKSLSGAWVEAHFWPDAWFSLFYLGSQYSSFVTSAVAWMSLSVIVVAYLLYFRMFATQEKVVEYFYTFPGFIFLAVTGIFLFHFVQHQLFSAPYPSVRSIVYYAILVVLFVVYAFREAGFSPLINRSVLVLSLLIMLANHIPAFGIRKSIEAFFSNDSYEIISDITTITRGDTIRLGVSPLYADPLNYYRIVRGLPWKNMGSGYELEPRKAVYYRDSIVLGEYDYLLVTSADLPLVKARWKLEQLKRYPVSDGYLLKVSEHDF